MPRKRNSPGMVLLGICIIVFSFCLGTWMLLKETEEKRKAYDAYYQKSPVDLKKQADSLNRAIQ